MKSLDRQVARALGEHSPQAQADAGPNRILIAADEATCNDVIVQKLQQRYQCRRVCCLDEARSALAAAPFDLLIIDPQIGNAGNATEAAFSFINGLRESHPATKAIVLSRQRSAQAAIDAMRCGAVDYVHAPAKAAEMVSRVEAALARALFDRQREQRLVRLKKVCKQLNIARHEISEQIDVLCHDLVSAYREMSVQVSDAAMASEFRTLLRQELDVEDLLRTSLEYTLTKTGPTNAAVFLPDGPSRYSLGAYVNYDCPRETIDVALEHLGSAICPRMAQEDDVRAFADPGEFTKWLGVEAGMLGESQVIAFACHHDDDCLAVIVLFRGKTTPFDENLVATIETLRPIFAEQLATIIKVHQRAQPQWPDEAHDPADEWDCDDDVEPGSGFGMAA